MDWVQHCLHCGSHNCVVVLASVNSQCMSRFTSRNYLKSAECIVQSAQLCHGAGETVTE